MGGAGRKKTTESYSLGVDHDPHDEHHQKAHPEENPKAQIPVFPVLLQGSTDSSLTATNKKE